MAADVNGIIAQLRNQGQLRPNQPSLATPRTSNETTLVGDRQLPTQGRTITPIAGLKGGYDVAYDGKSVGQLLRGGKKGIFRPSSGGANVPQVLNSPQGPPPGSPLGGMVPPNGMPMQLGGGQGQVPSQRQYTPNQFQQQMMQAQMIRNRPIMGAPPNQPISAQSPPPAGGLQYG